MEQAAIQQKEMVERTIHSEASAQAGIEQIMTNLGHIWKEKWIKSQINPSSTQQILSKTFAIAAVSNWPL